MTYIELAGLPGAGKSTLLSSLSRDSFHKLPQRPRPLGWVAYDARLIHEMTKSAPLTFEDSLKSRVLDSWSAGTLLEFPELFSSVLSLASLVPLEHRQRAIVLNYWRKRLIKYSALSASTGDRPAVVDEGLVQTLLSTVIRAQGISLGDSSSRAIIRRVVESFPDVDAVVHLRISPESIRGRARASTHWGATARTLEWLQLILDMVINEGIDVVEIDASLKPERVRADFEALI